MEFVENIEKNKYEKFVENHKTKSHFLQSYDWGTFSKENKNVTPYYVGLVDNKNKLVATALLLQRKMYLGYSYFYSPRGFVCDYDNKDVIKELTNGIKDFAKKKKALFLKIDPDIKLQNLDIDGNKIEGNNNYKLVNYLKSLGYKHLGYNKAFEHNQPRYTFRLDLTQGLESIKNNFHSTTKKVINKGNPYELEVFKNDEKYIDDFYKTMEDTANRENISIYSKEYYLNFYKDLHKNNHSDIYIVYLNKKKTLNILNKNLKDMKTNQENLTSENKKKELQNQIDKLEKLINEIKEVKEDKIPLSSIITAKYGDKVWTIHGGNHSMLRSMNSNYLIYYEIIKDAVEEGYKTIDFFGTSYNPTKDDPEYGIWLFKKRLGGEYTEFIGEFDYIFKGFTYKLFNMLVPIHRKISKIKSKKKNKQN